MRDYVAALPKTTEWQRTYVLAWNVLYTAAFINNGRIDPADPSKGTVAEGVVGIVVDPEPQTPEYGEFRRQYTALFPAEVTAAKGKLARNTANTFDAAVLIALAMERAKSSTDRIAIRDALFDVSRGGTVFTPGQIPEAMAAIRRGDDIDFKGASGAVDFDDTGNVKSDFVTWEVKDGAFVSRDRIEAKDVQ
jgi:ABC-type branched-subunit amino acid transport system substrate-binding protein